MTNADESTTQKAVAVATALSRAGVPFALGGALAYAYHAVPRQTNDVDFNVFVPGEQSEPVVELLFALGAGPETANWKRRLHDEWQLRIIWGETPVDLFFAYHVFHDVCRERSVVRPFAGISVPVLSAEDLTVFKIIFNRPRDWLDIERMLQVRGEDFDSQHSRAWAARILGEDDSRVARFETLARETLGRA